MPILGVVASGISGHLWPANSYFQIGTNTVSGSSVSEIVFSSIPSSFTHLQLRISGRSTGPYTYSSVYLQFNADYGNSYTYHALVGDGSNIQSYGRGLAGDNASLVQNISGANAGSNNYGAAIVDILEYKNTNKLKTLRAFGGFTNNGVGSPLGTINLNSSSWNSTSAITSIRCTTDGNFDVNTQIALYGIKVS